MEKKQEPLSKILIDQAAIKLRAKQDAAIQKMVLAGRYDLNKKAPTYRRSTTQ